MFCYWCVCMAVCGRTFMCRPIGPTHFVLACALKLGKGDSRHACACVCSAQGLLKLR